MFPIVELMNVAITLYFDLFILFCRSTVHSSTVFSNRDSNFALKDNQQVSEEVSKNFGAVDAISSNPSKAIRPPPRVPSGIDISLLGCSYFMNLFNQFLEVFFEHHLSYWYENFILFLDYGNILDSLSGAY